MIIHIYTDSEYSINCLTKWIKVWKKNGWKTTSDKKVKNTDIIKPIHKYMNKYMIIFHHVNSHTGKNDYKSIHNGIADKLAVKASSKRLAKKN